MAKQELSCPQSACNLVDAADLTLVDRSEPLDRYLEIPIAGIFDIGNLYSRAKLPPIVRD